LGYIDVKACELNQLLTSIDQGGQTWPCFADGLTIEKVMDAIDRSAMNGQWTDVQ
jgi:predicted dehydrogenase